MRGYRGLQEVTGGFRRLQELAEEKMNTNFKSKIPHASRLEILAWRYGAFFAIILFCIEISRSFNGYIGGSLDPKIYRSMVL